MKRLTVLEAVKRLTVLKFTPDRDRAGGTAFIQVPGNDREIKVWWRKPPEGEPRTLHFRPYLEGWAQLTASEQAKACKEILVAVTMHNAITQKALRRQLTRRR